MMELINGSVLLSPPYLDLLLTADPSEESIRTYVPHCMAVCSYEQDEPVGLCVFGASEGSKQEIYNLAVKTEYRRRGLALRMLEFLLQQAARPIIVRTGSTSFAALALYQKLGFRMVQIVPDYFSSNYDYPLFENGIQLRDQVVLELI